MAETMRFGGVELYNVHKTPELTGRGGPLHRYTAAATARELWQKGLCIPCFDTACDIAGEDCTETVTALMQLAHDVQCPYVSVTAQRDDDARISAALEALLPAAEAQGITILLKTSGVFSDTARLRALLDAVDTLDYQRTIVVFQPHTYSRTRALFQDFVDELRTADHVVLADIYAAREQNTVGVSSQELAAEIPGAVYCPSLQGVTAYLRENAQPGDIILTVGAGDIYKAGEALLKEE